MESGAAVADGDEAVVVEEVVAVGEVEVGADGAARGIDRRGRVARSAALDVGVRRLSE